MKRTIGILLAIFILQFAQAMNAPSDPQEAAAWYEKMDASISTYTSLQNKEEAIAKLGDYLSKLGAKPEYPDPRWRQAYLKAQAGLISIPGHAQYFANELERIRSEPNADQRKRAWVIRDTLSHIPSPETVSVLGNLLSDERDSPPPPRLGQDWVDDPSNAVLAALALSKIGLKDSPFPSRVNEKTPDLLPAAVIWWEKIKSGEREFSFAGTEISYRFKPDGTWDSGLLSEPPKTLTPSKREQSRLEHPKTAEEPESQWWPWCVAVVVAVVGCAGWIRRHK